MRIALLSDVHANLPALDAVAAHASARTVDAFWDLGDLLGYAPFPNETVNRMRKLCERHVAGNYDLKCVSPDHARLMRAAAGGDDKAFAFAWAYGQLAPRHKEFIRGLPREQVVTVRGWKALMTHGSPAGIEDGLTPRSVAAKFRALAREMARRSITVVLCGHTHEFLDRTFDGVRFINPGSVGRPFDGDPRAAYCILDISAAGISVERYRVEYPLAAMADAMRDRGFPGRIIRSLTEARSLDGLDSLPADREEELARGARAMAGLVPSKVRHGQQVARLALRIFDGLASLHGMGRQERAYLNAAALLHDIGWVYGQQEHHKSSRDLILKDRALPLGARERAMVALTARYHRRALPEPGHRHYKDLAAWDQETVGALAAILRIADGLDRSGQGLIKDARMAVGCSRVTFTVSCRAGADTSAELAAARDKADLFRTVFGLDVQYRLLNIEYRISKSEGISNVQRLKGSKLNSKARNEERCGRVKIYS